MQIAEQHVDLRSDPMVALSAEKIVNDRVVAFGDFFPPRLVASITLFRQSRTVEKLVGHALKCGDDYDDRSSTRFFEDNPDDIPDAIGCGQRRPTKFQNSHSADRI